MRVLMFGWEFPPQVSGGLGVACEGLVRGLLQTGTEVVLVLPRYPHRKPQGRLRIVESLAADPALPAPRPAPRVEIRRIATTLQPYGEILREEPAEAASGEAESGSLYGPNLATEVLQYAARAGEIALRERFDVIHAHDWMTFPAGREARRVSGRPLIVHVHATEFDRAGGSGNPFVHDIERGGVLAADRVIAVSRYTAGVLSKAYGVPRRRVRVIHNAIDPRSPARAAGPTGPGRLVLFAGRVTRQKGPEYFLEAAAHVAREAPNVRFAVAGAGDRLAALRDRAAALGLGRRVTFTGFLPADELDLLYARADVYVMPSASEPFGLTALEALQHGTPVIVSRGVGVSEVVRNVLHVDFGDVEELASKILSVLLFPPLARSLSARGRREVLRLSWRRAAERCLDVYASALAPKRTRATRTGARTAPESRPAPPRPFAPPPGRRIPPSA